MYALLIEFETDAEREEGLIRATRLYRRLTRGEAGNVRVEFLRRADRPRAFFLYELYRDAEAFELHSRAEHTNVWRQGCSALTLSGIQVAPVAPEAVDLSPPPLPPSKRPFKESSLLRAPIESEPNASAGSESARLRLVLDTLEFAAADAGFFQMTPEACFLIGAYVSHAQRVEPLARAVYRRSVGEARPCTLSANEMLLDVTLSPLKLPLRIWLFVLGLEENGGRDVARVYRDLLDPDAFRLWSRREAMPNPLGLREWCASERGELTGVDVLWRDELIPERLNSDTWVGAAIAEFVFGERGEFRAGRFHVASEDERNDWLVQLNGQVY